MKNHRWIYWLKLLAGIILIFILYQKINRREPILEAFRVTDWSNIALCIGLLIPNIGLAFLKWRYLLKNRFANVSNREVFGSLMFGYTLGLITPGRIGELGRGLFFTDKNKLTVTGLNLLDKAANQIIVFTLGGAALGLMLIQRKLGEISHPRLLFVGSLAVLLVLWLVMLNPRRIRALLHRFSRRFSPRSKIHAFIAALDHVTLKDSLAVLALSFTWIMVITVQYHILVLAFTPVSWWDSLEAVSAVLFVKTFLPFTFGDLGVREGVAIYFYSRFGISSAAVFNASLLVFLINFLAPALCGVYYLFQVREKYNGKVSAPSEPPAQAPSPCPALAESRSHDD